MRLDDVSRNASLGVRELEVEGERELLSARLYCAGPARSKRDSLIVFFHAGSFIAGGMEESDAFLRELTLSNPDQLILATDYTLAQVRPFPAAVEDAYAVLKWTSKNKSRLGWTGKYLLVTGIEAGANLAAVSAMMARDRNGPHVAGQILIMPMLDPGLNSESMRALPLRPEQTSVAEVCANGYRNYLPRVSDRCHPYASPVHSSCLKHLPPTLILSAQDDPLRDEAEQYGIKLISSGVRTTVRRIPAPDSSLAKPCTRNSSACAAIAQAEIVAFIELLIMKQPSQAR